MGLNVTATQAAVLTGHNERLIRWHILTRKDLPATKDGRTWRIDVDALRAIPGWRVDPARLAELTAAETRTATSMAARIAELERTVHELQRRVRALEGRSPLPTDASTSAPGGLSEGEGGMIPYPETPRPPGGHPTASGGVLDVSGVSRGVGGTLPGGLVSVSRFAQLHGVPPTTAIGATADGRLSAIVGNWTAGRGTIHRALDEQGRHAFYVLFGERSDFRRCPDCPH